VYNLGHEGTDPVADGDAREVVYGGDPANCDTALRECVVRASRGVRGRVGTSGEWGIAIVDASYGLGGWEFECETEETIGGCVCVEEGRSGGDGGEAEGVGGVSG